jgi:hypothetical protein
MKKELLKICGFSGVLFFFEYVRIERVSVGKASEKDDLSIL